MKQELGNRECSRRDKEIAKRLKSRFPLDFRNAFESSWVRFKNYVSKFYK